MSKHTHRGAASATLPVFMLGDLIDGYHSSIPCEFERLVRLYHPLRTSETSSHGPITVSAAERGAKIHKRVVFIEWFSVCSQLEDDNLTNSIWHTTFSTTGLGRSWTAWSATPWFEHIRRFGRSFLWSCVYFPPQFSVIYGLASGASSQCCANIMFGIHTHSLTIWVLSYRYWETEDLNLIEIMSCS